MQKLEIQAYSTEEAKFIAYKSGITVVHDATLQWRRSGEPILTRELNMFAADYMDNKGMFDFKDSGIVIAIKPGVDNSRKKPFKIQSARRKGRCKLKRCIEIINSATNEVLGSAENKTKALALAKKLVRQNRINVFGKTRYITSDIDFKIEYTPSNNTQVGQYVVFGVDAEDVRISKRKKRGFE